MIFYKNFYIFGGCLFFDEKREFNNLIKIDDNYPKLVLSLDEKAESYKGVLDRNINDFLKAYGMHKTTVNTLSFLKKPR